MRKKSLKPRLTDATFAGVTLKVRARGRSVSGPDVATGETMAVNCLQTS